MSPNRSDKRLLHYLTRKDTVNHDTYQTPWPLVVRGGGGGGGGGKRSKNKNIKNKKKKVTE